MDQYSATKFYDTIKDCDNKQLNKTDIEYMIQWNKAVSQFHKNRLVLIRNKQLSFMNQIYDYINKIISKKMILMSNVIADHLIYL